MPPHIVLPNGMWRFVKKGSKKPKTMMEIASTKITRKQKASYFKKRLRSVRVMARGRRSRKHSRRGMIGGGVSSLLKSALIGIGSAHVAGYVPVQIPMKEEAAGAIGAYLVGGKNIKSAIIGAGAVYAAKMLSNGGAGSNSGVAGALN